VVLESTYGNRRHDPEDPGKKLARVIQKTVARGGVVLIPSFAVGRAQALLYHIHLLKAEGAIAADLPVYLNSPMAVDAGEPAAADAPRLHVEESLGWSCRVPDYLESAELR
jgi:metallo-beta-lactamase family protein